MPLRYTRWGLFLSKLQGLPPTRWFHTHIDNLKYTKLLSGLHTYAGGVGVALAHPRALNLFIFFLSNFTGHPACQAQGRHQNQPKTNPNG